MDLPPIPERSPTGGAEPPLASPVEDELINHLMHGRTGIPATCRYCHEEIVEMPGEHYRLTAADQSVDRIRCKQSPEEKKRHLPQESAHIVLPIQAGDPTALGLPQETGGAG